MFITPAKSGSSWLPVSKRLAIYHRDDFECVYCGSSEKLTLDHVKDCKSHGRNDDPSNLVTCCLSCNSSKQDKTTRQWYKVLRDRGIDTEAVRKRIRRKCLKSIDREKGKSLVLLFKGERHTHKNPLKIIDGQVFIKKKTKT